MQRDILHFPKGKPVNPRKLSIGGPAANKAYHNDVILDTICQYVDFETAKKSLLVATKKLFVQAAKIVHRTAEVDILSRLHPKWCNYYRLCVYLQAIRIIDTTHTFPIDIDIPLLRGRFPNLMRVDFKWGRFDWNGVAVRGSIFPHGVDTARTSQAGADGRESKILGDIFIAISSDDHRIDDPAFGIYGPDARFHLIGLRLACCEGSAPHEAGGGMMVQDCPLQAITPAEVDEAEPRSLCGVWRETFKHLTFLTIANGTKAEDIPVIISCAPELNHLRVWLEDEEDGDDGDDGNDGDEFDPEEEDKAEVQQRIPLLLQVQRMWPDKQWDILEISEFTDDPQLNEMAGRFSIRHASLSWSMASVKSAHLARFETFEDWKRHINPLRLGSGLESLKLLIPPSHDQWDHHAVGTALSIMVPPQVKIILYTRDRNSAFVRWAVHVLNNRVRAIEQDRGRERKGYRLVDADVMPGSPGQAEHPDIPDESGKLKVDKVWNALSASGKYTVLRRAGAIGPGYYEQRRYGALHDADAEESRGFISAAQRYSQSLSDASGEL